MRFFESFVAVILVLCLLCASTALAGEIPHIVCTSFPCYDFARAVVGEKGLVKLLIKPGAEVHSYEPTPADIMEIAACDLFVYIGGESDAWVEDILASLGSDAPETVRLIECVEAVEASAHDHAHHDGIEYDEHIWTSPVNAAAMVQMLAGALSAACYDHYAADYRANADAYCAEINSLHADFKETVENGLRREMVFADRFPFIYFAREYGIDYVSAFPSCSSESEPSAKTMMELIKRVVQDQIPVIYTIELSSGKTAETIAAETGAKICTFHSVQNLTEADFAAGETYLTLMRRNLEALREGLN